MRTSYKTFLIIGLHATIIVAIMMSFHHWAVWFYELTRRQGVAITGFMVLVWATVFIFLRLLELDTRQE